MRLTYGDEAMGFTCSTREALKRAFGDAWYSVAVCLSALFGAESLAQVAALACVALRRIRETANGAVEFMISHGAVLMRLRADESTQVNGQDEQNLLAQIRSVFVMSIVQTAAVPA